MAPPLSLATTHRITFVFFSYRYLDVSVPYVSPHYTIYSCNDTWPSPPGEFPHSDICGSLTICVSPQLFAACHVLHRLLIPRHSPYALPRLIFSSNDPSSLLDPLSRLFLLSIILRVTCISLSILITSFSRYLSLSSLHYIVFNVQSFSHEITLPNLMVEIKRLELLTPCLQGRCSPI